MSWGRLDRVLVCTRTEDLGTLPELPATPPCDVREMDMADPADVAVWLAVHNDAFGHAWDVDHFERAILRHPYFDIWKTYFAVVDGTTVGVASMGVFRGNHEVGVGHYLGVCRKAQEMGVGRTLVLHRYHALRRAGIVQCESHTHVGRTASLRIHFECGFSPKLRFDDWNTPSTASAPLRTLTTIRLMRLYRRWLRQRR